MSNCIDLTMTLKPGMRGVEVSPKFDLKKDGWNASTYHLYSHAGTHMDAPVHFLDNGAAIEETPIASICGKTWVVEARNIQPSGLHTLESLGDLQARFAEGDSLLLRTGWSQHADSPEMYRDQLPRLSVELAEWLVLRKARMLLVEPPSVADVNNLPEVTQIHQTLLRGGVTIVEGLARTGSIGSQSVFIMALPLKIAGGDGCPCRVLAFNDCTDSEMQVLESLTR